MRIWLACEVRGGPFPDERIIHVRGSQGGDWHGFVNVRQLKTGVNSGQDRVQGLVLAVEKNHLVVGIEGQTPTTSQTLQTDPSSVEYGSI
jgi:hypothetical protein